MAGGTMAERERAWLADRRFLQANRASLTALATTLHPGTLRLGGSALLTRPEWLPAGPLPLERVALAWAPSAPTPPVPAAGATPAAEPYSATVARLDPPRVFENRPAYRLVDADVSGPAPRAVFTLGRYFDILDIGEAAAHELAAAVRSADDGAARTPDARRPPHAAQPPHAARLPLRGRIGDPTDPARRPMPIAVTTLTLRREAGTGRGARFLIHWRDPAKVATNGGMITTVPVGVFQPASRDPAVDFDLWRCVAREYREELLGQPEQLDVDYAGEPFYRALGAARRDGGCRPYLLGIGVDPLTLAVEALVAAVFTAEAFDALFDRVVAANDEGRLVLRGADGRFGLPFTAAEVGRLIADGRTQPASAAVLDAAWRTRDALVPR